MKIALLGAESTGKTDLSLRMAAALRARGHRVAVVPEVLREWCVREGRTPRPEEQLPIAREQEQRVDAAAMAADIVIADTTALMVAVYSAMLFDDGTLYRFALERQRGYGLTLVTGLDLPWVADGLQRDGPHVREPVDALVREGLHKAGVPYRVVYGSGEERTRNALAPVLAALGQPPANSAPVRWKWVCDTCSDPDCEHRLFKLGG
ncbi:ATP-binding protein [Ramlibacter tataouinensis]|uniref:ATP-binding protein n=1 Tax=Ramlibacter tataouinensis TaxID=94132 RepID=UPI0022F3CBD8|nr:ATP-binding protein [Ramlibacter tataouinensis]WBY02732.1 ATP-binding protein [Ramlibacter tataouinensis]